MQASQLFSVSNLVAMVGWTVLIFLPRWRLSTTIAGRVIPISLAILYSMVIALNWAGHPGGFATLSEVQRLFGNSWLLLAGWVHYLAFDLFVGSWQAQDARMHAVPHLLLIPCLVLTFLFGPVGLLAYLTLRTVHQGVKRPARTQEGVRLPA